MANKKHIHKIKFSAAKIVPSTATEPALGTLDQTYTDYEKAAIHCTNNGPLSNSAAFSDYFRSKAIIHHKIYPYQPQANPVETYKASYVTAPQLIQQYVQNQQSGYFGVPYHQDFSRINEDTAIRSQNAAEKDSGQCLT